MAKLINSLLSGSSGKIGQIVVVQLGDQEIIRALPKNEPAPQSNSCLCSTE